MTVRILILGAVAVALVVGGVAALWFGIESFFLIGPTSVLDEDLTAWNARMQWLQMLVQAGAPMVGAGLIVGVGALALVVRRRQVALAQTVRLAQAGLASATASRDTARS